MTQVGGGKLTYGRFTVRMRPETHRLIKVICAQRGITLKDYVQEAINEKLKKEKF